MWYTTRPIENKKNRRQDQRRRKIMKRTTTKKKGGVGGKKKKGGNLFTSIEKLLNSSASSNTQLFQNSAFKTIHICNTQVTKFITEASATSGKSDRADINLIKYVNITKSRIF